MTDTAASLRFVVLRHQGVPQPHFDLMIETTPGGALMTWRSLDWPITAETQLTRLGEHRRDYLEYEGPLSGDRGQVKRVAAGSCLATWLAPHELQVRFPNQTLLIQRLEEDHWLATES